eukprot:9482940-Pyramimonas_sp.AAC.1
MDVYMEGADGTMQQRNPDTQSCHRGSSSALNNNDSRRNTDDSCLSRPSEHFCQRGLLPRQLGGPVPLKQA